MADMDTDMTSEKADWFGWIFITAIVFLALGYCWRWGQEQGIQERSYEAAVEELSVVVREDICGN